MCAGGVLRPKLVCGPDTKRSATRLPISFGEVPAGHFANSFCWAQERGVKSVMATRSSIAALDCPPVGDAAFFFFIDFQSSFQASERAAVKHSVLHLDSRFRPRFAVFLNEFDHGAVWIANGNRPRGGIHSDGAAS